MLGVGVHLPSSGVPTASSCGRYRRILTRSSDDAKSAGKAATSDRSFESSSVHIQRAKQRGCVSRKDSTVAACLAPNGRPVEFQKTCTALRLLSGQHCAVMVTCVRVQMNIHACTRAGTSACTLTNTHKHAHTASCLSCSEGHLPQSKPLAASAIVIRSCISAAKRGEDNEESVAT
jgi:hypothetical protein